MTQAKALFLKPDKDGQSLAQWWVAIARDDRFDRVLLHLRASLLESAPTPEEQRGIQLALDNLLTLADNENQTIPFPSPGLHHHFDKTTKHKPA